MQRRAVAPKSSSAWSAHWWQGAGGLSPSGQSGPTGGAARRPKSPHRSNVANSGSARAVLPLSTADRGPLRRWRHRGPTPRAGQQGAGKAQRGRARRPAVVVEGEEKDAAQPGQPFAHRCFHRYGRRLGESRRRNGEGALAAGVVAGRRRQQPTARECGRHRAPSPRSQSAGSARGKRVRARSVILMPADAGGTFALGPGRDDEARPSASVPQYFPGGMLKRLAKWMNAAEHSGEGGEMNRWEWILEVERRSILPRHRTLPFALPR
jgi:hypothetical protein